MNDIDELKYDYEEDGKLVRKEVDREVLSKGAWTTIMFKYQELDPKTEGWKAPKAAIVRFQKVQGAYRKRASFNISSARQAKMISAILEKWFTGQEGDEGDEE